MKNIHLFETKNDYDAAKSGLILPTVSYVKENNLVDYNPRHDYVEIAGIKWATMNVGAESITDYGLYFQWGDTKGYTADQVTGNTEPKKAFYYSDYNSELYTKYNSTGMTLESVDDAVNKAWGGYWRMPTANEFQNLGNAVNTGWTDDYQGSKVAGMVCTDKNDKTKTLFFPACGYAFNGSVYEVGYSGKYWSSSSDNHNSSYSNFLNAGNGSVDWQSHFGYFRYGGFAVRGVLDEK